MIITMHKTIVWVESKNSFRILVPLPWLWSNYRAPVLSDWELLELLATSVQSNGESEMWAHNCVDYLMAYEWLMSHVACN